MAKKLTHIKQSDRSIDRELQELVQAINTLIDKVGDPSSSYPSDIGKQSIQAVNVGSNLFSVAIRTQDGVVYSIPGLFRKTTSIPQRGKEDELLITLADGNLAFTDVTLAGVVTSVTATAPVVSTEGVTPVISMAAATTSVNGYLTSTNWTTFNNKQATLVSGTNIKTVNSQSLVGSGNITIAGGDNSGNATLDANGTATVNNTGVTTANKIILARQCGNSNMAIYVSAVSTGVSFTITSLGGVDDASLNIGWMIL